MKNRKYMHVEQHFEKTHCKRYPRINENRKYMQLECKMSENDDFIVNLKYEKTGKPARRATFQWKQC